MSSSMRLSAASLLVALAAVGASSVAEARHMSPPSATGASGRALSQARGLSTVLEEWMDAAGIAVPEEAAAPAEVAAPAGVAGKGCSDEALKFIDLLNEYRAERGLDPIPASPSLCIVSDTHVQDLVERNPDGGSCGMHSWSDAGSWTSCCFPDTNTDVKPDQATMECSWDKPSELTGYPSNGYENTLFDGSANDDATPLGALKNWKLSDSHHMLMINGKNWEDNVFRAVGAGFLGRYAVMWVGEDPDPLNDAR